MKSPFSVLISGSGLAGVRLLTGVARSKWIATLLGSEGIGFLAQATQFQLLAASVSSFSTASALIQGAKGIHKEREEDLFRCAFFLHLVGLLLLGVAVLAIGPLVVARWLFGPGATLTDFLLLLVTVPAVSLSSGFVEAAFFIHDRFDRYAVNSSVHSVLQAAGFILFTRLFGARGLLFGVAFSAILLALLFYGDLARLRLLRLRMFLPRWDRALAPYLLSFGAALFLVGVGGNFLHLAVRALLVAKVGLGENGLLQVPVALSSYGGAIVTNFVWGRIHPHFSSAGERNPFELTISVIAAFLVALGTWTIVPSLVPVLYSREFTPAVPLVGIQCAGDVLYFTFFTLAVALLAAGQISAYVAGWLAYYLPFSLSLLVPGMLGGKQFFLIHFAASASATFLLFVIAARSSLLGRPLVARLAALAVALAAIVGAMALWNPLFLPLRFVAATISALAGLGLWRTLYGHAVDAPLRQAISWIRARLPIA